MFKPLFSLLLAAALLAPAVPEPAQQPPAVSAESAVLCCGGQAVFERAADEPRLIASTTKLMTALLVIEHCDAAEAVEILPAWCGVEGSSMYLRQGDRYSVRELLCGLLLASANDAAVALACHTAGSLEDFAALMNARAAELGMENTHYVNPHGLDAAEHYSTARDLARLMEACMAQPLFRELIALPSAAAGEQVLVNHNKLLGRCPGCLGGKTGYTRAAGRCLVSCAEREGTRFVCVTLSDPDDWEDHVRLYDWAFENYVNLTAADEALRFTVPVLSGTEKAAGVAPAEPVSLLLPRGEALELRCELPWFTFAPVTQGEAAGRVLLRCRGETLAELPLVYTDTVPLGTGQAPAGIDRTGDGGAMAERLQKIISAAGLLSRRGAEEAIAAGRVTLNGRRAVLGDRAGPGDRLCLDGRPLPAMPERVYVLLNKPRGYVCTLHDEKGRRCVTELLREVPARLYPVGRLDLNSEGLLLLTNDGALAQRLSHPSHQVEKTYLTWLRGEAPEQAAERLARPMSLDGRALSPAKTRLIGLEEGGACVAVTIHEGRNRQVRRMCEQAGYRVTRLKRVREGSLELGELKAGQWRYLTEEELRRLGISST